jgi:ribonuclease Z
LGELKRDVLQFVPGQKVCYVTDVSGQEPNRTQLTAFVERADVLFIEAVFVEADREMALRKAHLTTTQAGEIARLAQVREAQPFHFSSRYREEGEEQHRAEFRRAWQGNGR